MRKQNDFPWPLRAASILAIAALIAGGSGCSDKESGIFPNLEPNTRISTGPPERQDTSYLVNLFWFGWDDDGRVSHYEISWETPDNWVGPIFTTDSLFVLEASETCCVEPLPEYGTQLPDSVYEQFHTFYVRSVDEQGAVDPTPAVRSFNSKTIAPYTEVTFGPNFQTWGTDVEFEWVGNDDDGTVVSYEYMWTNDEQFNWEFGEGPVQTIPELIAWIDTLTYRPDGPDSYSDERIWKATTADSVVLLGMPSGGNYYFAVRAIDNAGAKEQVIDPNFNLRSFLVASDADGPRLTLISNIAGSWVSGEPSEQRDVFAGQGLRFRWTASPSPSGAEVAGFSHAVEDTAFWSAFTMNDVEWPEQVDGQDEALWFPSAGVHKFFVRAIDFGGFIRVLSAEIEVFDGPQRCPQNQRFILVVLDTDATSISFNTVFPLGYAQIERSLVDFLFDGYNFQIHETKGSEKPRIDQMDCASTTFWLHSADPPNTDSSVLIQLHAARPGSQQTVIPNFLPSYIESGGNFFLCGIEPVNAMKYIEDVDEGPQLMNQFPVDFCRTLNDTTLIPHWVATTLGVCRVMNSITQSLDLPVVSLAKSKITTGPNPYPDLPFDPLSIPNGTTERGFRYYDTGIIPASEDTEIIYQDSHDSTENGILGVRKLTSPGVNGNIVYLGFHPYFIAKSSFQAFLRAVMTDFGEVRRIP
jgi:hypothetical protein